MRLKLSIPILILVALVASPLCAGSASEPLDELVKRQEDLRSVHATFTQENYDPLLGRPIESRGNFYFRTDKGVRWEYEDALAIYDGSVLYVYSPETNEAEKVKGKKGFMGPLAFDVKVLKEEYDIRAERENSEIKLTLKPKTEMPFSSMSMIFPDDRAFPVEVTVVQETGEKAVIRFDNIAVNPDIKDEMFVFSPPPGTVVRERDFE